MVYYCFYVPMDRTIDISLEKCNKYLQMVGMPAIERNERPSAEELAGIEDINIHNSLLRTYVSD